MLKTVLIDDEEIALQRLSSLLNKNFKNKINLLPFCHSGEEGLEAIRKHAPQLVFLDVHMSDLSGFELLEKLDKVNFHLIFISGSSRFIQSAFQKSLVSYLAKPYNLSDLVQILAPVLACQSLEFSKKQLAILKTNLSRPEKPTTIIFQQAENFIYPELRKISHIKKEKDNSFLILKNNEKIEIKDKLDDLKWRLPKDIFLQVTKNYIVNRSFIKKIDKRKDVVILHDKTTLPLDMPVNSKVKKNFFEWFKSIWG